MNHNDESYATILLASNIRPDREELAEPLTALEWHSLRSRLRKRSMRMSDLIGMDMSALAMRLELTQDEAYRAFLLLSRTLPMSICLEKLAMRGIDIVTYSQQDYPHLLRKRLGDSAPPMLYYSGRPEIFKQDAIAILGTRRVKGEIRDRIVSLIDMAIKAGYTIVIDATPDMSGLVQSEVTARHGRYIEVLPGELGNRIEIPDITAAIACGYANIVSMEHPDKPNSLESAQARNKMIYALVQAAFIFGAENNRGAVWHGANENLKKRWCQRFYVWENPAHEGNMTLIRRGATPFKDITPELFSQMRSLWAADASEQMSMFDNETPL
ncbi:MAG: DNA-processing protein DprA [Clostridia bacterium]|nr:DNA-processing protein DprA [Clostridia bacterium]